MEWNRRLFLKSMAAAPLLRAADAGWISLFDGHSLRGWRASENRNAWRVEAGTIVADGGRSHLFYEGGEWKNFEFEAEVRARRGCNSGIFFHTRFQENGWPELGFEVQVNNTATGEGSYIERRKTASLYAVRDIYRQFVRDDEWFKLAISVRGKRVQVRLNGMPAVDYIEPDPAREGGATGRTLGRGTFALQCHDAGSKAFFRNLRVAPLQDSLPEYDGPKPEVDAAYREILALHAGNYPVVDAHVHLKGDLTLDKAIAMSQATGVFYGLAVNCGLNFPVKDDGSALEFLKSLDGKPVFRAMQAEGREWLKLFSRKAAAQFDYIFTDAMTFSDDNGRRMRLWIPEEVGEIGDRQKFMDLIVRRAAGILSAEPVDIYANPTFLPEPMMPAYDELWTPDRMDRVIEAAVQRGIAIEINSRYRIPSAAFLKRAKAAGLKFSFGSNNTDSKLGRIDYGRQMIRECGLGWQDIFVPKPEGERAADRWT